MMIDKQEIPADPVDYDEALKAITAAVVEQLEKKKKKRRIVKFLMKRGIEESEAFPFVEQTERLLIEYKSSPEYLKEMVKKNSKKIITGIIWAVLGTAVTVITYVGSSEGGTYVVAWGAVLFGVIDIIAGLIGKTKYKRALEDSQVPD
ncbi:hypothetical protein KAU32_01980 [bacterium]|nr:hypothetical protein [bacterium]